MKVSARLDNIDIRQFIRFPPLTLKVKHDYSGLDLPNYFFFFSRPKSVTMAPMSLSSPASLPLPTSPMHMRQPTPNPNPDDTVNAFLHNPQLKAQFKHHLNMLMQSFQWPANYEQYGVDPIVLMMMANSQDPRYSSIDFNAMLALYGKFPSGTVFTSVFRLFSVSKAHNCFGFCPVSSHLL